MSGSEHIAKLGIMVYHHLLSFFFFRELQGGWWKLHFKKQQRRERWDIQTWKRSTAVFAGISTTISRWLLCSLTRISWVGQALWSSLAFLFEGEASTCLITHWHLVQHQQRLVLPDLIKLYLYYLFIFCCIIFLCEYQVAAALPIL